MSQIIAQAMGPARLMTGLSQTLLMQARFCTDAEEMERQQAVYSPLPMPESEANLTELLALKKFSSGKWRESVRFAKRMFIYIDEYAAALAKTTVRCDLLLWALFADSYGFATIWTGKDFKRLQLFDTMAVQLPLNILSGIAVCGSDYVRKCLLAPPEDINRNPRGDIEYQSLQAWWKTTFVRKILWITSVLTSLPIHYVYNSIILSALPAYDAYEVMVDERFFSGEPFDVSAINLTQFEFETGAPMPYNTSWQSQWPASARLQQSLESVQQDPSSWTNLSNPDCRIKYGLKTYSTYRTVVLVTNWTQNLTSNDSALAVGAYQASLQLFS
ncbi:hypothetical protein MMC22_009131 [Lobaria immixta]|nr:hypothetical protein [Lobaria immixta]